MTQINSGRRTLVETGTLVMTLVDYWGTVFPAARRELDRWRDQAEAIPDRHLRELALQTLDEEDGLAEGAAIFATLVPRRRRGGLIRLLVAWQVAYDYVDTLGEQPERSGGDPELYTALTTALDPSGAGKNYVNDGGYLHDLIRSCRVAASTLESYEVVRPIALRAAERCAEAQSYTHGTSLDGNGRLRSWAEEQQGTSGYLWWEVAAGAISSLAVHAVLATAAMQGTSLADVEQVDHAYFPSVCALSTLLDSTIDETDDEGTANHRTTTYYENKEEAALRMETIAAMAAREVRALRGGLAHAVIVAGMAALYAATSGPEHAEVHERVAREIGAMTIPIVWTLKMRRWARRRNRDGFSSMRR